MRARRLALACALALSAAGAGLFARSADSPASAAAADAGQGAHLTLTIDQAISRALANQPLIQQAQAAVEAARARVGQANSTYYPFVSGTASYNRLSDQSFAVSSLLPPASTLAQLGITIPPNIAPLLDTPLSLVPVNMWDFTLGLNQVIFQFGKRGIQVKLAENGVSAAQIGVEQIRTSLGFQAAQGFYSVLFLRGQLTALDEQLHNLQEHLAATQIKAQAGAATRYDELSTEVRISALQSQRIEAETTYEKQLIGLKQLLGIDESTDIVLSGDFSPPGPGAEDEQSLISSSMAQRPDVRQAVEAESAAELNRRLATAGACPTISAHASMGFKNGILPDINVPAFNWVAGVQVSVPLFQGFLYARMGEEADKKVLAARENTIAVRRAATTQVLQALQDVKASHEQVQNAQAQLDQTKDMQDVVKLQYDLGMLSNLEYLDAQVAQERAQLGSLQARYREVLSQYALKLATGSVVWASGDTAKDLR